ncbi:MAG TPA: ankyrin repeat domain-containing protein [Candidatus Dependentiae bacterium]|nr:ankyrin repeat domain-containing protein [Candidatus Dependentiae bacterium]
MHTKQTNLFILLLFLAGISTVVDASEGGASLLRVLSKRVQENELEHTAFAAEITGKTRNLSIILKTTSPESKNTLLRRYVLKDNSTIVQCLLEANADPFAQNEDGWSVLTLATWSRNEELAKCLLKQRAEQHARENDYVDVVSFLEELAAVGNG